MAEEAHCISAVTNTTEQIAKARRLMAIDKRNKEIYATQLLAPKSDMDYAFHLFLSHTWDQVTRCL